MSILIFHLLAICLFQGGFGNFKCNLSHFNLPTLNSLQCKWIFYLALFVLEYLSIGMCLLDISRLINLIRL